MFSYYCNYVNFVLCDVQLVYWIDIRLEYLHKLLVPTTVYNIVITFLCKLNDKCKQNLKIAVLFYFYFW